MEDGWGIGLPDVLDVVYVSECKCIFDAANLDVVGFDQPFLRKRTGKCVQFLDEIFEVLLDAGFQLIGALLFQIAQQWTPA